MIVLDSLDQPEVVQMLLFYKTTLQYILPETSIDVLPPKNQAPSEYCTNLSKLKHCRYFN